MYANKKYQEVLEEMESEYEFHELCLMFPLFPEDELENLVNDIKVNGLLIPIVKYKDKIIDGRNRLFACLISGIIPIFTLLNTVIQLDHYIIAIQLTRRHLTPVLRAEIGLKIEEWRQQQDKERWEKIQQIKKDKKQKIIIEHEENKRIAQKIGSTPEFVKQVRDVKDVIEEGTNERLPEIKKSYEKAKKNQVSIKSTHEKTKKPKRITEIGGPESPKESTIEGLQEQIQDYKYQIRFLEAKMTQMINKLKELGEWEKCKKDIFPDTFSEEVKIPSMKKFREAELI